MNKLTLKDDTVSFCLYVADPATCPASNSVQGTLFSSEDGLFIKYGNDEYFSVCIIALLLF